MVLRYALTVTEFVLDCGSFALLRLQSPLLGVPEDPSSHVNVIPSGRAFSMLNSEDCSQRDHRAQGTFIQWPSELS